MRLVLDPPLKGVTKASLGKEFSFFAALLPTEGDQDSLEGIELELWTNIPTHHAGWSSVPFQRTITASANSQYTYRLTVIPGFCGRAGFTVRSKHPKDSDWSWIGHGQDGTLHVTDSAKAHESNLDEYLTVLDGRDVYQLQKGKLWEVVIPIGDVSDDQRHRLCTVKDVRSAVVYERQNVYWTIPIHAPVVELERDAIALAVERTDGQALIILPVSTTSCSVTLLNWDKYQLLAHVTKISDVEQQDASIIVSAGANIDEALQNIAIEKIGKKLACEDWTASEIYKALLKTPLHRYEELQPRKKLDNFLLRHLTYCTWNSLGGDVSEKGILSALSSLKAAGIQPTCVLIDDGWQTVSKSKRLQSFQANSKFPNGLGETVARIKQQFPYVQRIGVWHTAWGYWDGIDPKSDLGEKFKLLEASDGHGQSKKRLYIVAGSDALRFYTAFYSSLASQGIDFVKVDCQARFEKLLSKEHMCAGEYQEAIWKASRKTFNGRIIYCMAHSGVILTGLRDKIKPAYVPPVLRSSDDYFPNEPNAHTWHVHANVLNHAMFYPTTMANMDYDMFQTTHPTHATWHAASRAFSGGPIMITDPPGGPHRKDLVLALTAQDTFGCDFILRTPNIRVCDLFVDSHKTDHFLKFEVMGIWPAIVIFNCRPRPVSGFVHRRDIRQDLSRPFIISKLDHNMRFGVTQADGELFAFATLNPIEWHVYSFPILNRINDSIQVALCGMVDKFNALAAIEECTMNLEAEGYIKLSVNVTGRSSRLCFYIAIEDKQKAIDTGDIESEGLFYTVFVNNSMVPDAISVDRTNPQIVYVDMMKAPLPSRSYPRPPWRVEFCIRGVYTPVRKDTSRCVVA